MARLRCYPSMAQVNVELKARDPDPEATLARCLALGAVETGVLVQRDTYFAGRDGRLKLREQDGERPELIAYRRPDSSEASESTYVLAPVADADAMAEALDAGLGATVVVSKRRRLLLWEGVRIHLDEVEGLGSFVEFEAVLPDAGDVDDGAGQGGPPAGVARDRRRRARVRRLLGPAARRPGRAAARRRRGHAQRLRAVLRLQGRRRRARAERRDLRRRERGERGLPPGAVRGGLGARRAGRGRRIDDHRRGGGGGEAGRLSSLRRLPATADRVRSSDDAGLPRPAGLRRPTTVTLGEMLPGSFDREALEA